MNNQGVSTRLEGQVAIVTGVSHAGQVGFALASAMAHEGSMLTISSRTAGRVNARSEELRAGGAHVIAVPADLTTEEGANAVVRETLKSYSRIDILVNLAGGLTKYGPSDELTLADWDFELNNNLRSAFLCSRAVWPIMKKQNKGKILNFSRAGGVQAAGPNMLAYNCAKAGVDALTRTLAKEGEKFGIYVNAIGPGLIITQSNIESMKPSPEDLSKKWVSIEQIIEAAIFLISPASDGITGAILPVQGMGI
jgi:NAD(P)-dependent dehydrogenase (short-subunit alcohol dehydrogenase family)